MSVGVEEESIEKVGSTEDENSISDLQRPASGSVAAAVLDRDWAQLKALSLSPGGFGAERTTAWLFLLHVVEPASKRVDEEEKTSLSTLRRRKPTSAVFDATNGESVNEDAIQPVHKEHPDEHQIKLDTDRSFVMYPEEKDRSELQTELNEFITSVFRRHPKLGYFQGYHDIITVLFLTLPKDDQILAAEKFSLHRLRDAMGTGLEPLIGLLRVLKYLIHLADPSYSALLERNTPLPYFALSNLLTLFAHDVPTLPLIQHIFDYLLCRPPIASVYLAAALTLSRKEEALLMAEEGEEGMMHSLLSSLPDLWDGEEKAAGSEEAADGSHSMKEEESILIGTGANVEDTSSEELDSGATILSVGETGSEKGGSAAPDNETLLLDGEETSDGDLENLPTVATLTEVALDPSQQATSSDSQLPAMNNDRDLDESRPSTSSSSGSAWPTTRRRQHKPVSLPNILSRADELYALYPPSHPSLHVRSIMGLQSVIFTWNEDPEEMSDDAEAEAMVEHPELVVLPFEDPDEAAQKEVDSDLPQHPQKRRRRKLRKRRYLGVNLNKKTVLTGAVVALSVAVALYSVRNRGARPGAPGAQRVGELRKAGRWLTDVWLEGSAKVMDTLRF